AAGFSSDSDVLRRAGAVATWGAAASASAGACEDLAIAAAQLHARAMTLCQQMAVKAGQAPARRKGKEVMLEVVVDAVGRQHEARQRPRERGARVAPRI